MFLVDLVSFCKAPLAINFMLLLFIIIMQDRVLRGVVEIPTLSNGRCWKSSRIKSFHPFAMFSDHFANGIRIITRFSYQLQISKTLTKVLRLLFAFHSLIIEMTS
jgi:hypothetical protein